MGLYTVERVDPADRFSTEHGQFQGWDVRVSDGTMQYDAQINSKILPDGSTKGPTIGERIEGELTKTQYGYKLKRSRNTASGGNGGGNWKPRDPKETAQIVRQHSQEMAIRLLAVEVVAGLRFTDAKASDFLKPRIDFFQLDAEAAGEKAG